VASAFIHAVLEVSPWYPRMKLWRQKAAGDWGSAILAMLQQEAVYIAA
jgi:hypothetical protein